MWGIIGHQETMAQLSRAVQAGRVPQTMLITGPAGVGKGAVATALARALVCTGEEMPCGQCLHCHQADAGTHPDISVIEPLEGKESIAIQQTRDLREGAALRPFQAPRKVFIVREAETLTPQAADSLLKVLEEPPPYVTIILTAVDAEALPPTVVSRCRVLTLRPVSDEEIAQALAAAGSEVAAAERISRLARGRVGWALEAAKQSKVLAQQEDALARLVGLFDLDAAERLSLVDTVVGERRDRVAVRRHLELLSLVLRDLLLLANGRPADVAQGDQAEALQRHAERLGAREAAEGVHRLTQTMRRIDRNVDPRLALEALFLGLP